MTFLSASSSSRGLRAALILIGLGAIWAPPLLAQSTSFPARNSARIVFVGHSLINYQMPFYLSQIAASKSVGLISAVQVLNGTPLLHNWGACRSSQYSGQYPPKDFACEAIEAGTPSGPYDTLIATDANNSIESNRIWNETHKYFELFMNLMLSRNSSARSFVYTSWEGWDNHASGTWIENIPQELAQYELIASQAQQLSQQRGQNGRVDVLPVNVALKELLLKVERGEVPGISSRMDIFSDDTHMSKLGNYYVACVVFAAVYNQTPAGATATMNGEYGGTDLSLSSQTASALQSLAWQTITNYRGGVAAAPTPKAPQNLRVQ